MVRTVRISGIQGQGKEEGEVMVDLDNHADTCVVSTSLALVTQDYMRPVRVHAYDGSTNHDATNCKTVSAVVAYDSPVTGEVYYLVLNQAICVPTLESILLCPNQMRDNDVMVNDEPKSMVAVPSDCLLYTSPSPRDGATSRMPSSA